MSAPASTGASAGRHLVLIHGAWQGAWAFDAWAPLMAARGWQVHAVDLPGNGKGPKGRSCASLDSYTGHVSALLRRLDGPAVVVGHSGGGITASQVAEVVPDRVAALVYLAGMMLPSGVGFGDLIRDLQAEAPGADLAGITPWLEWNADRSASRVPEAGALACFLHDIEPGLARAAAAKLGWQPESGRAMRNTLTAERYGRVPRLYVECRDDRSVFLPLQQAMQQRTPGAQSLVLDCGHVPQLACPARLTELLCAALDPLVPG